MPVFFLFTLFSLSQTLFAACPGTISADTNMTQNESSAATCFVIGTPNITLDCKGYTITLTAATAIPAINIAAENVTIQNCNVVSNSATVVAMGAIFTNTTGNGAHILDTNVSSIGHYTLHMLSSSNTITNVRANTSTQTNYGAYFASSSNNVITSTVFNKTGTASSYALYWLTGDNNLLDNVTVDSSVIGANKYGARFDAFTNSNITNSRIYAMNLTALWLASGSSSNRIDNVNITAGTTNTGHGVYMDLSSGNQIYNSNMTVPGVGVYILSSSGGTRMENLTINSTASSGIYIDPSVSSDSNVINNVTVSALNYPLFFSPSSYNVVENSTFNSTANYAFYSDTIVTNNRFFNNTFRSRLSGGTAYAMYFTQTTSNNEILNNTIYSPTYYALYFGASDSNTNTIAGNNITAQAGAGYGVTFAATPSSYNNISNNRIYAAAYGVQVYGDQNYVNDNNISAVTIGVYLVSTTNSQVMRNYINTTSNSPIYLSASDSNVIGGNTLNKTSNTAAAALYLTTATYNTIENNTILGQGGNAVTLTTSANNNNFTSNYIYTNMTAAVYGIQVTTNCQYNRFIDNNITAWNATTGGGVIITSNSRYNLISGGYIYARNGTGVIISSSSYNNVTDTNISTDASGAYQAIYLTSANNNRFVNVSASAQASYAAYLTSAVNNNVFNNATFYSNRAVGVYLLTNVYSNSFRNFEINTNNTNGLQMDGAGGAVYSNNFTNGTIRSNATTGYAVYFNNNVNTNIFKNVSMNNTEYRGVYFLTSSNNLLSECSIAAGTRANSIGVLSQTLSTNNQIVNSTITTPGVTTSYDFYFNSAAVQPSNIVAINTTFDQFNVAFLAGDTASYLNVSWYLRANVTDLSGAYPIEAANVVYKDTFNTQWANLTTDANGFTGYAQVLQYKQNISGSLTYTPYSLNATTGTVYGTASSTPTSSTTENINVNASICQAISADYILTNNVYGSGDCFQATAPGLTLDCAGYKVNYSRTSAGCGFIAGSFVNLNIRNCSFVQGSYNSSSSGAICLSSGANATVANSSITALGNVSGNASGYDFSLSSSNAIALGTATNSSNSYFSGSSSLRRSWYLNVNLTDLSGSPIPSGTLLINNTYNSSVANASVTDGVSPTQVLVSYLQTGASNFTFYSNFTIYGYTGQSSNFTLLNLTSNANIALPINISACGAVGASTTLRNNVYSNGTCFVPSSSGITIDCNGYSVNYSRFGDGFYGIDTSSYDNIVLKNCQFVMGNASATASYALYVNHSTGVQLANSSISGNSAVLNISSLNTRFINTAFNNSSLVFGDASSNLSVEWYANVHVTGLADEAVNNSQVNVTNAGGLAANATTNATGDAGFLLTQYSQSQSAKAYSDPYNFTAQHPNTLMLANNYTNLTGSVNITLQVISAAINVTTPTEGQIFFQGDTVNITVNVTLGQSWVTNATVEVTGDAYGSTYQATEISPGVWRYQYHIDPSQPAAALTINARGYNGTAYVTASRNFVVTRTSGSGIAQPVVDYFCPLYTYNLQDQATNVTISADLDTVVYSMVLTVVYPNGSTSTPSTIATSSDLANYIYNYTWSVNATQNGNYTLNVAVRDVNDNTANSTVRMYASLANVTINLSASGISSLHLRDVCSGTAIRNGSSLLGVSVIPGNYSLLAVDPGMANITFNNFNVSSYNGSFLTYAQESASGLSTPTNRRNIQLFSATVNGGAYSSASVLFDYNSLAGTLVAENSLEIDTCASRLSCTWSLLNSTLNTTSNLINATVSSLSGLYGTFEPAFPTPTPEPVHADYPAITKFAPGMQNALLGSNVTVYLYLNMGANLSSAYANVSFPQGSFLNLTNISYSNATDASTNHSYYNYTYSFIANETGIYALQAFAGDRYYQNITGAAVLNVAASNISVNITSYGINNSSLSDPGMDVAVLSGGANLSGSIAPGNYTYRVNASNASFTISSLSLQANGSLQVMNYSDVLPDYAAPANRSGVYLFNASNSSVNYSLAQVTINYTGQVSGIISEVSLEAWQCTDSSCASMSRLNATINTAAHTAQFNLTSMGATYGLYQPLKIIITPIQAPLPVITRFTTSRQNAVQNSNVTIYLNLQMGANLSTITLNSTKPGASWQLLTNNSVAQGPNYTYNLTYSIIANEIGAYNLTANATDIYSQSATSTITFNADASSGVVITSYGVDNTSVVDTGIGTVVLSGGTLLVGSLPPGYYTFLATAGSTAINMSQLGISGIMSVLNYSSLSTSAVTAPTNRTAISLFYFANLTSNFTSAAAVMNYTSQLSSIVSEPSLEIWACLSTTNCTSMTRLNATLDTTAHTATFNLTSLYGVYGLYQPQQTVVTPIQVPLPAITRLTTSRVNVVRNDNVTVYLDTQLGASISSATINVTRPSGGWQLLSNESYSAGANYTYNYTYSFIANETGTYTVTAAVSDYYSQNATSYAYLTAAAFSSGVILTSYGLDSSSLVDTGIWATVLSGASVLTGSIPLGSYTYLATAGNASFNLSGLQVYGNLNILNYTALSASAVTAPTDRGALYLFNASNFSITHSSAQATINYTSFLSSIISEAGLEVWKCADSSCASLTQLNATIDAAANTVNFSLSSISGVYGLFQPLRTVITPVQADSPSITRFTTSAANVEQNSNVTVYLDLDLGVDLSAAAVNATSPLGTVQNLSNSSYSNASGYLYYYTYVFSPNETGTYTLRARANDTYGQNASSTIYISVAPNQTLTLVSNGVDNTSLVDTGLWATVLSGNGTISGNITPGNYTYIAAATGISFNFSQLQVGSDLQPLNYTSLSTSAVAAPTNRSALLLFSAYNGSVGFSSAAIAINYTSQLSSIVSEAALEVWACPSVSNCTSMAQVAATINTSADTATFSLSDVNGVYGLYQSYLLQTQNNTEYITVTQYQTSTSYKDVEKKVEVIKTVEVTKEVPVEVPVPVYTAVRLISAPTLIEMHPEESREQEIRIVNNLGKDMGQVTLTAVAESPDIEVGISQTSFDMPSGASQPATLSIKSKKKTGTYNIKLMADVPLLNIKDELSIPVRIGLDLDEDKLAAKQKLEFAQNLLKENPECLDLNEGLTAAALFIDTGKYAQAQEKAQGAISGCSGIIALRGKPTVQTETIPQIDWSIIMVAVSVLTGMAVSMGLGALMLMRYMRGRKIAHQRGSAHQHEHAHAHHGSAEQGQPAPESPQEGEGPAA